jgi:threonine aldolase
MARPNFASDNEAPVHSRVMDAITRANVGPAPSYGADAVTAEAVEVLRRHFGSDTEAFLVLTGTAANVLALGSCLRPWEGVICPESAHIAQAETGAPEWHLGTRLLTVPTKDGKLRTEDIRSRLQDVGNEHVVQPRVVSISQVSEYGTVYRADELRALSAAAHGAGLLLHMDGARLANAAAALGTSLREVSRDAGVDVLSLGATKNGALGAEAVVFFRRDLGDGFRHRRKQGMQLASKMRYVAAQMVAMFGDDTWLECARHANAMSARLAAGLGGIPGVRFTQPVDANQIFVVLPANKVGRLEELAAFHAWQAGTSEYRFVTSFATTPAEVDAFIAAAKRILMD